VAVVVLLESSIVFAVVIIHLEAAGAVED